MQMIDPFHQWRVNREPQKVSLMREIAENGNRGGVVLFDDGIDLI
jgi:hypothetical protein